jgi:3-oxoacyl-(acyl-carrier-protein) synthase
LDRWSIAAHYDPAPGRAGKSLSKWGGFIENIDRFDSGFFGISTREADGIDPQQRLLLEASWEAFEDGGQTLEEIRGSSTGVFVGISTTDYAAMQVDRDGHNMADVYSATGSAFSIAANRISYCFDMRGPSVAMDTACSSALTACHVACQSLGHGDCSMAVVAGVNALLNHDNYIAFSRMSMLSPDGRTLQGIRRERKWLCSCRRRRCRRFETVIRRAGRRRQDLRRHSRHSGQPRWPHQRHHASQPASTGSTYSPGVPSCEHFARRNQLRRGAWHRNGRR